MTNALHRLPVRTCPACGSAVNTGALTCNSCGGVIAVESVLSHLKQEFRYQAGRIGWSIRDPAVLIWVLAACPILILPPLLALFMSFRSSKLPPSDRPASKSNQSLFVAIVAICNIVLSIMFWRWLSEFSLSGLSIGMFLRSLGVNVHSPASSAGQI
ncbi:zinc ribbon domain-containing protein [Bradyrhizobium symbiodeficiens]|uniref:zinc ribbon domain-containing protein n=1 Tax=Bradyrhizobium symbiodeficiens TaxID=1404367 RepID=UPI0030CF3F02